MKIVGKLLILLGLAAVTQAAQARDTEERKAIQAASLTNVLGPSVVPALVRKPGPTNDVRLASLLEALPSVVRLDGKATRRDKVGEVSLESSTRWFVTVGSEGDHFDYRDEELCSAPVWDQAPAMPLDVLIEEGRAVLEGALAPLVALEPTEELVPMHSFQEVRGLRDNNGKLVAETVAVNFIDFARKVDGVPVLGHGSRLRLGFSPLGRLASIDATWPRYKVVAEQRVNVATPATVAVREAALREELGVPLSATASRFECGYLDYGESRLLQPGCRVDVREGEGEVRSFLVPAAVNPADDPTWPELELLRQGGVP